MSWRNITDRAKRSHAILRLADQLGRSRGRLRLLDRLDVIQPAPFKPDLRDWNALDLAATWIGHATVLLRIGGLNILTDPVLSNRVGLGFGLFTGGPLRLIAPALRVEQLPPLDLILISHAHYDHLDRPTLVRLPKRVPVITASGTRDLIDDLGFRNVTELRWGESKRVGDVLVTAREVQHWGARTFYDRHRGFNAYLLEAGKQRVLYGGDTAYQAHFKNIPGVDLAILGIGAYDPYVAAHATPEQALMMADHARAERILPIHHSTFRLSHERTREPIERIFGAAGSTPDRIVAHEMGTVWTPNL